MLSNINYLIKLTPIKLIKQEKFKTQFAMDFFIDRLSVMR